MRRSDKEITEFAEKLEVLDRCDVIRLGMVDDGKAYVVPVNFGYSVEDGQISIYFHCAGEGRKVDVLAKNPNVFFEADYNFDVVKGEMACKWTARYASVMGEAVARQLVSEEEKTAAFKIIMKKYGYEGEPHFDSAALARTHLYRLAVTDITAKKSKM
ncbi:MAG: pyridoxamine 5'-phosphate oxidase family protein [Clostridia bacterium]|nr:pyridoxamine 5'-phosphate oxidase family protein [[Bacteroides] pectinophilus]MDD5872458.1 pyridoxamine 5'-phosphate oxidase family protein [Clostridia bacterium]